MLGVMAHAWNPTIWEAGPGGSLWVDSQPGLYNEFKVAWIIFWDLFSKKQKQKSIDSWILTNVHFFLNHQPIIFHAFIHYLENVSEVSVLFKVLFQALENKD